MLTPSTPNGFRTDASGIIVPSDLDRPRETWTKADVKVIDRATRLLKSRGIRFQFACAECGPSKPMELVRDPQSSWKVLRCPHKDRILSGGL